MVLEINDFLPETAFKCDLDDLFVGVCITKLLSRFPPAGTDLKTDDLVAISTRDFSDKWCYIADSLANRTDNDISDRVIQEFNELFASRLFSLIMQLPIVDGLYYNFNEDLTTEEYLALSEKEQFIHDQLQNIDTLQFSIKSFLQRLPEFDSDPSKVMDFVGHVNLDDDYNEDHIKNLYREIEAALVLYDVEKAVQLALVSLFGVPEF